nr:hypothetical protein [Tanacetum cinerariifolium]
ESLEDDEDDEMDIEADEEEEHPAPADFVVKRLDIALGPRYEVGESSSVAAARPAGAWVRATNASDLVHGEVMSLRTTMLGQMSEIRELQAADRRRQTVILELLRIDHRRSTEILELRTTLQGQVTALQGQVTALQAQVTTLQGQQGLAGDHTQSELPEEAGGKREVGYGITDSWDEIVETLQGAPVSTNTELGGYVREFEMRVRPDTDEIYMRLDDEQTERQLLAGRRNMLFRDRRAHAYTRHLMETEARMSKEAWVRATDASDLVHGKVMSLRTTVLSQMSEIRKLQAADRRRQTVISELLRIDHRRSTEISELRTALQGQVAALQGQVIALQA